MKNLVAIFIFFFVSLALNASSVDIIRPSFLTIETQPSDSIVFEGEKTKFETKAKYLSNEWNYIGFVNKNLSNEPNYIWLVNKNDGKGFVETDCKNRILEIEANLEMDGYQYRCEVSYLSECKSTKTVILSVKPIILSIDIEPKPVALKPNSIVEFTACASISNNKEIFYLWQIDKGDGKGFIDTDCTTQTLSFTATQEMEGYQFRCVISGEGKTKITKTANLKFFEDIEILKEPQNLELYEKQKGEFTFDVKEKNGKKLKYTWYVNKNDGKGWKKASTAQTLKITASKKMHNYRYYCEATNGADKEISNEATLTVYQNVKIVKSPKSQKTYEGDNVKFEVEATGHDVKYQWQYYNALAKQWVDIKGENSNTFEPKPEMSNSGYKFRCEVSNGGGKAATSAASFTVYEKPELLNYVSIIQDGWEMAYNENGSHNEYPVLFEGYSATFYVFAKGYKNKYQWQVLDSDTYEWKDIKGATKSSFTIKEITEKNNEQTYCCKIYNDGGETYSNDVKLTVQKPYAPKSLARCSFHFSDTEHRYYMAFTSSSSGVLIGWAGSKLTVSKYKRISFHLAELKFTLQYKTPNGKIHKETFDGIVDFYSGLYYCDYNPRTNMYETYFGLEHLYNEDDTLPENIIGMSLWFYDSELSSEWLKITIESKKVARYDLFDEDGNVFSFYGTFTYKKISDKISTFSGSFKDGIFTIKIKDGFISSECLDYNMVIDGYPYSGQMYFE